MRFRQKLIRLYRFVGPPPGPASVSAISSLASSNKLAVIVSVFNALLFVAGVWGRVPPLPLLLWLTAAVALFAFLRIGTAAGRVRLARRDGHDKVSDRAMRRVTLFAVLIASPWGVLPLLFLGSSDAIVTTMVLMVCAGTCAGGASLQHRVPIAAAAFIGTVLSGVVAACILNGIGEYWPIVAYSAPFFLMLHRVTLFTSRIAEEHEQSLQRTQDALAEVRVANQELDRLRAAAERDASHDELTGLWNRRGLKREIARRAQTESRGPLGVFHIDLDRFKQINDTLGHAAGDHVLRHAAAVLRSHAPGFVARVGGDEFILMIDDADRGRLETLAERLITALSKPISYQGEICHIGASIGVDITPQTDSAPAMERALSNADIALYRAKQLGRNRFAYFCSSLRRAIETQNALSDAVLEALEAGLFKPFYQPQFRAGDHALCGLEALARWRCPRRGDISPAVFLPVADRLGVTRHLDEQILTAALGDLARWEAAGLHVPRLAVNVSSQRLRDPALLSTLDRLDIPTGRLSFEILESVFADHVDDQLKNVLDWLEDSGVDLELDDFGTGHTSLLSLLSFKPERIKIARELAGHVASSNRHRQLVSSVVDIAKALEIDVLAEGVETEADAAALQAIGCMAFQGYYFAKPMSAEDVLARYGPKTTAASFLETA